MNNPHIKEGSVKYTRGFGWKYRLSKILSFVLKLIPVALILVVGFIFYKQPIRTESGFIYTDIVRRTVNQGEVIVVVEEPKVGPIFGPLENALVIKHPYEAEVIAGPYGQIIERKDGSLAVKSTSGITSTNLSDIDDGYLDSEYVVRNDEGIDLIVSKSAIIGKPAE